MAKIERASLAKLIPTELAKVKRRLKALEDRIDELSSLVHPEVVPKNGEVTEFKEVTGDAKIVRELREKGRKSEDDKASERKVHEDLLRSKDRKKLPGGNKAEEGGK